MFSSTEPLVSCIMPTYNRREFIPHAIRYFLRQDYANKELIILDDGADSVRDLVPDHKAIRYFYLNRKSTLGAKLNLACTYAQGNIIVHWDDDDWYAPHRLQYQVEALQTPGTDVCGINNLLYYDLHHKTAYRYIYPPDQRTWLLGSSLCYRKALWAGNRFADIDVGMDGLFVWGTDATRIRVLPDSSFSVHMIHGRNVSPKKTEGRWWHPYPVEDIRKIMHSDWQYYQDGAVASTARQELTPRPQQPQLAVLPKQLQNIHACLVHEHQDCIIDLVRNLHYQDPASLILLYNGSQDPHLIPNHFPFEKFKATIIPDPVPVKHGYLHDFALRSMAFALKNFSFDTITIVDSDQLALRSGYTQQLSAFFSSGSNIGMLSSKPERVTRNDKTNHVALQAFKEYDLWKPFLAGFPDGESKFVHWTFWPSTVFTYEAVSELVKLFRENRQLQEIMARSKIWASEEVILPTLVRLLGYEIVANPCSYDFVQYRKSYSTGDMKQALQHPHAFWIHPVERRFDDPLRKMAREQFEQYHAGEETRPAADQLSPEGLQNASLLQKISKIEGWLSNAEANLLIAATKKVLQDLPAPQALVEIGSYHGKATVLLGSVVKGCGPQAKVYAIDTHDGILGAVDQGLQIFPPSFDRFKQNIEAEALSEVVVIIKNKSYNVPWQLPVSLLLIDGLHDYLNVSRDFRHFSNWVVPGGYVAFHDYAVYFPGVQAFVDELLATRHYRKTNKADSLIVLQRI